ncbi:unnamed protein product [Didymodactylos carnosus]|uniref:Uncharacterized protein n=1 Tax=Didymodactylos carnosus TaxID=1234261 RepID=A0A815SQH1_9BILA|nr:unnamed protein product [Didymodactylos carnosus]CAF1493141.1 unnamed protein product [Didymodactylos carnosus]CAF4186114.1 unnamed protein product [Didymodactylos carnosus]CAF4355961.1 unnamed protein product [Didymodactylos carnosus]
MEVGESNENDPPAANSQARTTQYATAAATTSPSTTQRHRAVPRAPATFSQQQLEIKSRSYSRSPSQEIHYTLENLNRSPVLDLANKRTGQ